VTVETAPCVVGNRMSEYRTCWPVIGRSRRAPVVEIPEAHHHLILDQPLAFVAALRTLLADWEHSIPKR
jgi:pimeloyl-ACP methyl ester carboxylesterase